MGDPVYFKQHRIPFLKFFATQNTVWYPKTVMRKQLADYPKVIAHELEHVRQWRIYGLIGFPVLYFLSFPFPIVFAKSRFRLEMYAFLSEYTGEELHTLDNDKIIDFIISDLCGWRYGFPWPKKWARRDIRREIEIRKTIFNMETGYAA